MDIYRKAKNVIHAGELGDIIEICIEHDRTKLLWSHPHSLDLMLFYSECMHVNFVQAICELDPHDVHNHLVDADPFVENGFIKFKNGINDAISTAYGMNTRISRTNGTLIVKADGTRIDVYKEQAKDNPYSLEEDTLRFEPEMSGTQWAFHELAKSLKEGRGLSNTTEEIALSQNILFALARSSLRGGKGIKLSDMDSEFTVTLRSGTLYA